MMPIYDLKCLECGHEFDEYFVSYKNNNPKCEVCGGDVKRLFATTVIDMDGIVTANESKKRTLWQSGSKLV